MTINMEDKAAIVKGEYVTFGHIKGRKQVTITIEFPEEMAVEIFNILGTPVAEVSKPVAVCLLRQPTDKPCPIPTKGVVASSGETSGYQKLKSEGEKLRQRACILCGEYQFWQFLDTFRMGKVTCDDHARVVFYGLCNISSRKELVTNKEAQEKFKELDRVYIEWSKPSVDETYKHNLERTNA